MRPLAGRSLQRSPLRPTPCGVEGRRGDVGFPGSSPRRTAPSLSDKSDESDESDGAGGSPDLSPQPPSLSPPSSALPQPSLLSSLSSAFPPQPSLQYTPWVVWGRSDCARPTCPIGPTRPIRQRDPSDWSDLSDSFDRSDSSDKIARSSDMIAPPSIFQEMGYLWV